MDNMVKGITKQYRIVNHFKSLISSGVYKSGDTIPPEITLAEEFGVNRGTVGKALASLANSGIITRRQGSGTYVSENLSESLLHLDSTASSTKTTADCSSIALITSLQASDPHQKVNHYSQILSGIDKNMLEHTPSGKMSFHNLYPTSLISMDLLSSLKGLKPSGIIYLVTSIEPSNIPANIIALKNSGIPFVATGRIMYLPELDSVTICESDFGFIAAKHLLDKGHRNILYAIPEFTSEWLERRIEGFKQAVIGAGMKFSDKMLFRHGTKIASEESQGIKSGKEAAEIIIKKKMNCTGIATVNDAYAVGMLEIFKKNGVDVPGQVSIVGTDDDFCFRSMNITTVRQPNYELGEATVEMLLRKISDKKERGCYEKRYVKPSLIERSTTARVNGNVID